MPAKPGFRSAEAVLPANDNSVQSHSLGLTDTVACNRRDFLLHHCGRTVAGYDVEAVFDPGCALFKELLPPGARILQMVRHKPVILEPDGIEVRRVILTGPLCEVMQADGSRSYLAPLPPEIDPDLRISRKLRRVILRLLGHHSLRAVRQMTLAPRRAVETVAREIKACQREAMHADRARPVYLSLDTLDLKKKAGKDRPALHLVASDPARGLHWSLTLIDWALGEEALVELLAEEILALPEPEAILALVTDYGEVERRIAAKVVEKVQDGRPGFRPQLVIDRFHIQGCFRDAMAKFRVTCWKRQVYGKNGRRLKNVSAAARQREADIKGAANSLEKVREAELEKKIAAAESLKAAFKAAPELKVAYRLLEDLRQIFDCRRLDEAERLYAAWKQQLEESELDCFKGQAEYLAKQWPAVRAYFEVLEKLDHQSNQALKVGSNVCESLNRQAREIWRQSKGATIARIEQRLLARQGYVCKAEAQAEPTRPKRRAPRKKEGDL